MRLFLCLLTLTLAPLARAGESGVKLAELASREGVRWEIAARGTDTLVLAVTNGGAAPLVIDQPAGFICTAPTSGAKLVALRAAQISVAPRATAEAVIPAAALAWQNPARNGPLELTAATEPRLPALLDYLATRNDVPRLTTQLAVLVLLEDVTFAQWQQFLAPQHALTPRAPPGPTPAEVTAAIDVLGILREIAAPQTSALATDGELKLRALRNPWCRVKAMQLYGMTFPAAPGDPPLPPDLGTLLHTRAGDNCPICRQRALMQQTDTGL